MFSQTSEYALRAMICLADASGRMTAPQIAKVAGVPQGYLAKILSELARGGLVVSQRGIGGGFSLARPADQISILDVINAVDGFQRIAGCPLRLERHTPQLCPLHRRLDAAMAHVEASLAASSLAELLAEETAGCPFPSLPPGDEAGKAGE